MMRYKWVIAISVVLTAVAWSLLSSCSKKQSGPTGPGSEPATIHVSPSHGAPGSPLEITGYSIAPGDTTVTMHVGGHLTPFVANGDSIVALVPLFLEEGGLWPKIPSGTQDVFIIKGADTVAYALGALTIDTLPHADGTMETIAQDLQIISSSLGEVLNSLAQLPGQDERLEGYRLAISFMLDSLISGADSSIQSILSGSSSWTPQDDSALALQDAVMASCGALDYYNSFANSVGQFSRKVSAAQSSIYCRDGGPDMDLACQMQIYTILEDYKNYVVKPTAQTYTESVKIGADLIAISGVAALPILVINSIMSVWEFVYGTLAPSLFPAEITAFALTLDSDTIGVGEPTYSTIAISARNIPSTIKATQVLDILIDALAAKGVPQGLVTKFREILKETIKFALDLYRKCLVAYNDSQGGAIFIDPEADLPEMTWGPVTINHSDLIELFSLESDILQPDTSILEWIGLAEGEGAVYARGRAAGVQAKVLYDYALCAICVYSGGAFGNNTPGTGSETVVVGRAATLNVQITGLSEGTDAAVFIDGPGGYSSGSITQSTTLTSLKSGDYHIRAFAVRDAADYEYIPTPVDTTVTLAEEDDVAVEINYKAKYGSLLVTVAGLPSGIHGDITLSGSGTTVHIVSDTLIDSLLAGVYSVAARDVIDTATGEPLTAEPPSQTVEVIGRETATCAVTYNGGVKMILHVGNPFLEIRPIVKSPIVKISEAQFWPDPSSLVGHEIDQDLYPTTAEPSGPPPAFNCDSEGALQGGFGSGLLASSVSTSSSSAEGDWSVQSINDTTVRIEFSAMASADAVGASDSAVSLARFEIQTWSWAVLEIRNNSTSSRTLHYSYRVSGSSTGNGDVFGQPACGWGWFYLGFKRSFSCSELGVGDYYEVSNTGIGDFSQQIKTPGPVLIEDQRYFLDISPGTTYVQLVGFVNATANSQYFPNSSMPRSFSAGITFDGTIDLELR